MTLNVYRYTCDFGSEDRPDSVLCLKNVWLLAGMSVKSYITKNILTTVLFGLNNV